MANPGTAAAKQTLGWSYSDLLNIKKLNAESQVVNLKTAAVT